MILRTSPLSPFGRKARLAAVNLGLTDRVRVESADSNDPNDALRRDNPLGKMPVLVLDDGRAVFDSPVILEALDHLAGGGRILPTEWSARIDALTLEALADGIGDAAILIVYERRYRPEALVHEPWLEYQRDKIRRSLMALEAKLPNTTDCNVGTLTLACMLAYLDLRKPVAWRDAHPGLVGWFDAFRRNVPAFDATAATP